MVGHVHLDQDVAREEPLRGDDLLAAAHLRDLLGRDQDLADVGLQPVRVHALFERLLHLVLEPRVGVDDVPLLRAIVGHRGCIFALRGRRSGFGGRAHTPPSVR
jgi:hypothetical protein